MLKDKEKIDKIIIERYSLDNPRDLAKHLGLSLEYLRVRAMRLGVRRKPFVNDIIDGMKYCPCCEKMKSIDSFNRDKYQPNGYDYYCRKCRSRARFNKIVEETKREEIEKKQEEIRKKQEKKEPENKSQGFGKGLTRNAPVIIGDKTYLRCKACNELLEISNFSKDKVSRHGHKNYCKTCISERRKQLKK